MLEFDSSRGRRSFVHGPGSLEPLLQEERGEVFAYVTDQVGVPHELVDAAGRVAWAASLTAFGRVVEEQRDEARASPVESPFRLLGQVYDEESGLSWTRFRCFDGETGGQNAVSEIKHVTTKSDRLVYAIADVNPRESADDVEIVTEWFERTAEMKFERRQGDYKGGDYCLFKGANEERVYVQKNYIAFTGDWMEEQFSEYPVLVCIQNTRRPSWFAETMKSFDAGRCARVR